MRIKMIWFSAYASKFDTFTVCKVNKVGEEDVLYNVQSLEAQNNLMRYTLQIILFCVIARNMAIL